MGSEESKSRLPSLFVIILGSVIGVLIWLPDESVSEIVGAGNLKKGVLAQQLLGGIVAAYLLIHIWADFWDPKDWKKILTIALIGGLSSQQILKTAQGGFLKNPLDSPSRDVPVVRTEKLQAPNAKDTLSPYEDGLEKGLRRSIWIANREPSADNAGDGIQQLSPTALKSASISDDLEVLKSTFCLGAIPQECTLVDSNEIDLFDMKTREDEVRKLIFRTLIRPNAFPSNVVHVWYSSGRSTKWDQPVHISISDGVKNFTTEDKDRLERRLSEIKEARPKIYAVQAVILSLARPSRSRTYSSIRAVPGKHTVEVWDPDNHQVVAGGEAKIILIKSSSESN